MDSQTDSQTTDQIYEALRFYCEDGQVGLGPVLSSFQNGTISGPDALQTISASLRNMIEMGRSNMARYAFMSLDRANLPASLINKPVQRLEWAILVNLIPLFANNEFATIHRELVFGMLETVQSALLGSDDSSILTHGTETIAKQFRLTVMHILQELIVFLEQDEIQQECNIKQSVFKTLAGKESDVPWMSLQFSGADDVLRVACFLMSSLCSRYEVSIWPLAKSEEDIRLALLSSVNTLLQRTLPRSARDTAGRGMMAISRPAIDMLYKVCSECIEGIIPLLSSDERLMANLARTLAVMLYAHVMTVHDRFKEWVTGAPARALEMQVKSESGALVAAPVPASQTFQDFRETSQFLAHLESHLTKAFQTVMKRLMEISTDSTEMYSIQYVLEQLLSSEQLQVFEEDETGRNTQRTLVVAVGSLITNCCMLDPSELVDCMLSRFSHLEPSVLAQVIHACLKRISSTTGQVDQQLEEDLLPTHALKRTIDDVDVEMSDFSTGKKPKVESPSYTPSVISVCSSIVISQLSQRASRVPSELEIGASRYPTDRLLEAFKKHVCFQTSSYAASQGSRGVKPPLSTKDLRSLVVILHVWARFVPEGSNHAADSNTAQLLGFVETILRNYFLWALSPGMQDATLNSSYLESSYPLVLQVIASLASFRMGSSLRLSAIILASGPWFTNITSRQLWQEMAMDTGGHESEQELVCAILSLVDGTEIEVRLRTNPQLLLQAGSCFRTYKQDAMRILATLPFCPALSVWRHHIFIRALNSQDENRLLQLSAVEALAVMSLHCPDKLDSLQAVARLTASPDGDLDLMMVLSFCLGIFACGHSLPDRQKIQQDLASFSFDCETRTFVPRTFCSICGPSKQKHKDGIHSSTFLDPSFLDWFARLAPLATSPALKLTLLGGLYRAFCHLDLSSVSIQNTGLGAFVLQHLSDSNMEVAAAAGDIAELVSSIAGEQIALHPLDVSSVDDNLAQVEEAVSSAFSSRSRSKCFNSLLHHCQRIMKRLPEDHPTYTKLLGELISQSSKDPQRTTIVLHQFSEIARDKNLSNYRSLRPQIELTCALVIEKLALDQETWLQSIVSWTGLSQSQFIQRNMEILLPKMVLVQRADLIQNLAARLSRTAAFLCIENVDHVLAAVFMQNDRESVAPCVECFRRVVQKDEGSDPRLESLGISELSSLSTPGLLFRLSVELGDVNEDVREKAASALEAVKDLVCSRDEELQEIPRLSEFLGGYILGILSDINNSVLGSNQDVSWGTKARYLRCLLGLTRLLQPIRRTILSQIFSPLLIALDARELRLQSLQVMVGIVRIVPSGHLDELLSLLVHTLAGIYQCSRTEEQPRIQEILDFLVLDCEQDLAEPLENVGALPNLPNFRDINRVLSRLKQRHTLDQQLRRFIERSRHENANLAAQALLELKEFLLTNEQVILDMALQKDKEMEPTLYKLIQMLLEGIGRYKGLDADVPRRCIECLGIVGAIDPTKLARSPQEPTKSLFPNFNDLEDSRNFVCELIQAQLVGRSRTIGDFRSESRWAFALQTLLSFCGITKAVLIGPEQLPSTQRASSQTTISSRRAIPKTPKDRWYDFPRHVRDVLELFIDAKYSQDAAAASDLPCPLFPEVKTFQRWITLWTRGLISKVKGQNAREIFQALKHVALNDTNTCQYILPHLVLNVLLEGSEQDRAEILTEIGAVLGPGKDWRNLGPQPTAGMPLQSTNELYQLGSQAVFALLDHISNWIQSNKNLATRTSQRAFITTSAETSQTALRPSSEAALARLQKHLASISNDVIARASYRSQAYARALLHYEQNIRDLRAPGAPGPKLSEITVQSMYEELQEIYINLEEPDGMEGISYMITSGSRNQQLLQYESAGRWNEAQAYYEQAMKTEPEWIKNHVGLFNSLENLGKFETMLMSVQGDISSKPDWEETLNSTRIGAAWKLMNWDTLEMSLSRPFQSTFETGVGQLLLDMRGNRAQDFAHHIQAVRSTLIAPLAAASMESYSRAYDSLVKLHMLHEMEVAFRTWNSESGDNEALGEIRVGTPGRLYMNRLKSYESRLAQRLDSMAPSFRVREQVLRLRRIAFYDLRIPESASESTIDFLRDGSGQIWLQTAKMARQSGSDQTFFGAMLQAEELKVRSALIERVKWGYSHQDEQQATQAIESALTRSLALPEAEAAARAGRDFGQTLPRLRSTSGNSQKTWNVNMQLDRALDSVVNTNELGFIRSKALLLRTRWQEQSSVVSFTEIINGYKQAVVECDRWEKGYYYLGQYYFKMFEFSRRNKTRTNYSLATTACRLYGRALTLGPKYLYQILPRLLTFWLDLGQQVRTLPSSTTGMSAAAEAHFQVQTALNAEFSQINTIMETLTDCLPVYMFLSAFPQIISRICHKNADAFAVLQHIIVSVVILYPDQALWQMVSLSKSIVPERKRVCNKILDTIQYKPKIGMAIMEHIREALDLCDQLISLCMAPVPEKVNKLSLEKHFAKIAKQLRPRYNVMVPLQLTLWPTLPESSKSLASHQPFLPGLPKINGFRDEVDVMSSLQRPRKITMLGSDGKNYTFLCKPKDDLRKDAKVMEFNQLVNTLLRKSREANKRCLYIRTYAVVPLNEECGLIEWVHNTIPYRHIVQKQYKVHGVTLPGMLDIKRILDHDDHVNLFTKELLPKFPTVFYQWFKDIASDPTSWFAYRLQYTRTMAVMSMVGHILGLGDRHGENLLFDERNGDLVHVDFNCLFELGKTFPKPEKVPFRLTHNMVDAMGLSKTEGVYQAACEETLKVFRANAESLISVLEGFVHDPLVEWSKNKRRGQQHQANGASKAEDPETIQAETAQAMLSQVRRKLGGNEPNVSSSLSVKGQVQELIQVATAPTNLSEMYVGWNAFM